MVRQNFAIRNLGIRPNECVNDSILSTAKIGPIRHISETVQDRR